MAVPKKSKFDKFLQDEVKDHHQLLTNRVIERLEDAIKYKTPWIVADQLPMNPVTGTVYKGINCLSLLIANYNDNDNRFYTYNNIKELAAETGEPIHVRKGEKGIPIFKAMQKTFTKTDTQTQEETKFGFWTQIYAGTVFNATQIEGLPPLAPRIVPEFETNDGIEAIAKSMVEMTGLKINHHHKGVAFYQPTKDELYIPNKEDFLNPSAYYRTLMHELSHATGGVNRLDRNQKGKFGSTDYAFEELVAELSSYFMGNDPTINLKYESLTDDNHVAYIKSWLGALQNDKNMIFKASSQASRAVEYQFNIKNEYDKSIENSQDSQEQPKKLKLA
jgi:antirestriction protein ArdC